MNTGCAPPNENLKRRRLVRKESDPKGLTKHTVGYKYSAVPARRFVAGAGSQPLGRRILKVMLPNTHDLDIRNAVFTIAFQLVNKLGLKDADIFVEELAFLEKLATDRDGVIRDELGASAVEGKDLLLAGFGGKTPPAKLRGNECMAKLSSLSRVLRWLACSCLPDAYALIAETDKKWPEASTLAMWWQRAEDHILRAWQFFILEKPVTHVSLHFDGLRTDRARVLADMSAEECAGLASARIREQTGFDVAIIEKGHFTFMEFLSTGHGLVVADVQLGREEQILLAPGNCIPLSIWRFKEALRPHVLELTRQSSVSNNAAAASKGRSFRECCAEYKVALTPHVGFNPTSSGVYLVVAENLGSPHCVPIEYNAETGGCTCYYEQKRCTGTMSHFKEFALKACDRNTIVSFLLCEYGDPSPLQYEDANGITDLNGLLDMIAGAISGTQNIDIDWVEINAEQIEPHELTDVDESGGDSDIDEGTVRVHSDCTDTLAAEVAEYKLELSSSCLCRLCPFRSFANPRLLRGHVNKRHTAKTWFVASGTKQRNVVFALFDADRLKRTTEGHFLARSAALMRSSIIPPLSGAANFINPDIVLVLDSSGPEYRNKAALAQSQDCRRVGYTYYTRSFADLVLRESLQHHGRVRTMIPRICACLMACGSEVVSLLPRRVDTWLKLIEDVFNSAYVTGLQAARLDECCERGEFDHVSLDATIRIVRRMKGQADYRSSKATRNAAPVPDAQAKRRVLTVVGRTGAALGMHLVPDEGGPAIAESLRQAFSEVWSASVQSVASDQPTARLYLHLKQVFTNIKYLSLDPVHLPIVYEYAHFRKRSPGSRILRVIMAKFTKVAAGVSESHWGTPYCGTDAPPLRPNEQRMRTHVLEHTLPITQARAVLERMDGEAPWVTPFDFIEAVAALSAVFQSELHRRTHVAGVQLKKLLWNATAPHRLQWYFNNLRFRHSLLPSKLSLLGSGTSRNEALHAEVNRWFRNQPEVFASTVELQLRVSTLAKLQAHNCALYSRTLRQLAPAEVLFRSSATLANQRGWIIVRRYLGMGSPTSTQPCCLCTNSASA